ncbi:MAG: sugar ABC transporter substrate-binding protein [Ideonella sp.]|nr:sugar ABC transporter substrate-binding protein [Ideonella sp.]
MKNTLGKALVTAVSLAALGCAQAAPLRLQVSGDPAELAGYRDLIKAFNAAVPGVEVELVPVGKQRDHMAKLATGFAAGDPPDLFLINFRRFGQFAAKGVLEPLGPALASRGKFRENDYYEPANEAFRNNGVLLCVPQNVSSLVVYYNVALLKKAGLPPPPPNWSWADFQRYAKALTMDTKGDGKIDVYGFGVERMLIRAAPLVWMAGGDIVDNLAKPTRLTLDTPAAIEALDFMRSFVLQKHSPPLAESKSEDYEARFARGALGMVLNSRRFTPMLRAAPDLDWDVAPLPRYKQNATVLHADAYCMSKASTNKDSAYRFMEFAAGPVGSAIVSRSGRTVPALKSVAESPDFLDASQRPRSARVFLDVIPSIRRTPNVAVWNEVETRNDAIFEDWYFNPQLSTKDLAKALDDATRGLFASGGK